MTILRTVAGPEVLDEAASALDHQWSLHDRVPQTIRMHVGIAVAELVANTVEHGSAGRHRVQIEMQISVEPSRVLISLIDDGNECRVDLASVHLPDGDAERGRGLAMAKSALQELTYRHAAAGNHWLLTSKPF